MTPKSRHSINIIETPFSTVTSSGHWFHATRATIEDYTPDLLKKYSFEDLVNKAVVWIDSADSLAMILFFVLIFTTNIWIATAGSFLFHIFWYQKKSAFVNIVMTPVLSLLNKDFFQLLVAAVALSFMGISGMYAGVGIGIVYFFLYKIGLLRRLWDKLDSSGTQDKLPLNDRVLKMVLVRYGLYENVPPAEAGRLDREVRKTVLKYNEKLRKKKK